MKEGENRRGFNKLAFIKESFKMSDRIGGAAIIRRKTVPEEPRGKKTGTENQWEVKRKSPLLAPQEKTCDKRHHEPEGETDEMTKNVSQNGGLGRVFVQKGDIWLCDCKH